ncbi:phopshatase [Angomonas deanei]|uniref:Leucine rich repeat/Dual specificity phosphatase, catalytic domain containing protein, putative n=1 Tax=Angomonas deanei TaxID=59799 RepID=A0A7G2CI70_9TRYP|nr:phopshatase [Angomonas deanei]CAD2219055.1 Leucine rich repeat/Dual specificity phosphatase, catalytic domain containing protein, putative [Angomonas deanei]|eukprot:EPY27032.1 phopshatase [Angomonas deanei]
MFEGKNCKNLIQLDVNSNSLKAIPQSLFKLKKLEVLSLNHNQIVDLPLQDMDKAILPSILRIGMEFNLLKRFPVEFIEQCTQLNELNLTNNEPLLDHPVPLDRLLASPLAKGSKSLLLRLDNRPRFIEQMQSEKWSEKAPWLTVDLQKIYPDKVLDFLYLGSVRTAQTVTVYHDLDIKYVLTVGRGLEVTLDPGMKHLVLPINDFPEENMSILFQEAFDFIDEARKEKKGILIHCFAGLSRSVTIAAAYIMKNEKMTRDKAMDLIKQARPAARPNDGFMNELLTFEKTLGLDKGQ